MIPFNKYLSTGRVEATNYLWDQLQPPKKAVKWRGEPMPVAKVPVENVENYEIRAKGNKTYAGMGEVGENVL